MSGCHSVEKGGSGDSELPPSISLRSALEQKAREAGIGCVFMIPKWWSEVRALHARDGVGARAILKAFEVCLAIDLKDVRFFPDRFPKYVAYLKRQEVAKELNAPGRQQGDDSRRSKKSERLSGHTDDVSQEELDLILAEQAARGSRFAADTLARRISRRKGSQSQMSHIFRAYRLQNGSLCCESRGIRCFVTATESSAGLSPLPNSSATRGYPSRAIRKEALWQ